MTRPITPAMLDALERRIEDFEDLGYGLGVAAYEMALAYVAARYFMGPADCERIDAAYNARFAERAIHGTPHPGPTVNL